MVSFHERAEVADAVRRGRAVSDSRLAAQAVERARRRQSRRPEWWVVAVLAVGVAWLVVGLVQDEWYFVVAAPFWSAAVLRGLPLQLRNASRAERANRELLEAECR